MPLNTETKPKFLLNILNAGFSGPVGIFQLNIWCNTILLLLLILLLYKLGNSISFGLVWFGLVRFYGISTVVGYLMPNPFLYIYTGLF